MMCTMIYDTRLIKVNEKKNLFYQRDHVLPYLIVSNT